MLTSMLDGVCVRDTVCVCVTLCVCVCECVCAWGGSPPLLALPCVLVACVMYVCMSGNNLGAKGGAAVAEAMKSCRQLTSVNLSGMYCVMACC